MAYGFHIERVDDRARAIVDEADVDAEKLVEIDELVNPLSLWLNDQERGMLQRLEMFNTDKMLAAYLNVHRLFTATDNFAAWSQPSRHA